MLLLALVIHGLVPTDHKSNFQINSKISLIRSTNEQNTFSCRIMVCCIIFLFDYLNGGDQPVVGVVSGENRDCVEGLGDVRGESGG